MKAVELEKAYAPKSFEDRIYAQWKESGAFKPKEGRGSPYVIVIPPPNVTGVLHLGHGLNITLQDIVIRFHRMRGAAVLWVPGTDHAGIATQNVVEKKLKEKGLSRHELGREKFVEETWKVKAEHHAVISKQLARIGASVDWSRERFTLDEGLSQAVREAFVTLYERDLLYKGHYLVNWCRSCGTALSDDEVEHEKLTGKMYHIRYPRVDGEGSVEIATTRPETLLGDTAVAVHPDDPRYAALLGRELVLPLTGRKIPVIADSFVDRDFGTGAVKITPAHDPNDFEMAKRHNLPEINILSPDGRLNDAVPEKYRGLMVTEAREAVLADLKAGGFYVKEEEIVHAVGHCYRCHTVIEPFLSEQWFVRMKPLADKALAAWRGGDLIFYPKKWENTYRRWLENIKDWCVSRQLWWGHRIPAWRCKKCGETQVSRTDLVSCPRCGSAEIEQDPDVLDTWFSSWLWPFSTLGWPSDTSDFDRFYPTTALVTAYDIIFFWVSRMIMAGLEFTGRAPFRDIYIHGLVRDKQGRKMSKSLGNGLDPLQLVDEYGADAFKFTLAFMCAQGQDILIDEGSFKLGSKFANKVWNAARYILMNLEGRNAVKEPALLPIDLWIRSRLNSAARTMTASFLAYRYNDAAQTAYEYFWNDFCDWYVEATKLSLREGDEAEKDRAATVLLEVLAESLRLLHPLIPFVTEEIYGKLPWKQPLRAGAEAGLLIKAPYPEYDEARAAPELEADFAFIQELVTQTRTLRSECTVPPSAKLRVLVRVSGAASGGAASGGAASGAENSGGGGGRAAFLRENAGLVKLLAGLEELVIEEAASSPGDKYKKPTCLFQAVGLAGPGFDAFVSLAGAVDLAVVKQKFSKELAKDSKFIEGLRAKLSNEDFIKNAPPELVKSEGVKLEEARKRTAKLESYIKDLL